MSVFPTAKQDVAAMQEMPARPLELAPDGFGLVTMFQLVPFHRSTSVEVLPVEDAPTAKQFDAPVHDTPWRKLPSVPARFGLATMVQLTPFHRSTSVWPPFPSPLPVPTAKQLVTVVQDTPERPLKDAPGGLGLAAIDQLVPFQCSISGRAPELLKSWPTVKQLLALIHDTAEREFSVVSEGLGLATMDQLVPFQCSIRVFTLLTVA
jgi:hypothetical protein